MTTKSDTLFIVELVYELPVNLQSTSLRVYAESEELSQPRLGPLINPVSSEVRKEPAKIFAPKNTNLVRQLVFFDVHDQNLTEILEIGAIAPASRARQLLV